MNGPREEPLGRAWGTRERVASKQARNLCEGDRHIQETTAATNKGCVVVGVLVVEARDPAGLEASCKDGDADAHDDRRAGKEGGGRV